MNLTFKRRKAAGLCINCGLNPPLKGRVRCSVCSDYKNKDSKKGRELRRRSRKCWRCGKKLRSKKVACQGCRKILKVGQPERMKRSNLKLRDEVFAAYGGYSCVCCGETEPSVLNMDHIEGGGCKHEKEIGSLGMTLYRFLRTNNFPDGYQVLCCNCNIGKHRNEGICPVHLKDLRGIKHAGAGVR